MNILKKHSEKQSENNSGMNALRSEPTSYNTAPEIKDVKPDAMLQVLIRNYQNAAEELSKYLGYSKE